MNKQIQKRKPFFLMFSILFAIHLLLQVIDSHPTLRFVSLGFPEGNPLLGLIIANYGIQGFILLKALVIIFLTFVFIKQSSVVYNLKPGINKRNAGVLAFLILISANIFYIYIVFNNYIKVL